MTLDDAIELAVLIHAGQRDKAGLPYIMHVIDVANRVTTVEDKIVAVLHDTIESRPGCRHVIANGCTASQWAAVFALTRFEDETYAAYIDRVSSNPTAVRVKIADIQSNLSRPASLPDSLRERYEKALRRLHAQL
jgi:(p)ppGpp synthase/HD superfamily hydrolase